MVQDLPFLPELSHENKLCKSRPGVRESRERSAAVSGTPDLYGLIKKLKKVVKLLVGSTDTCPISKKDGETKVGLSVKCLNLCLADAEALVPVNLLLLFKVALA